MGTKSPVVLGITRGRRSILLCLDLLAAATDPAMEQLGSVLELLTPGTFPAPLKPATSSREGAVELFMQLFRNVVVENVLMEKKPLLLLRKGW